MRLRKHAGRGRGVDGHAPCAGEVVGVVRFDHVAEVVRIPRRDKDPVVMLEDGALALWSERAARALDLLRESGFR